MNELIPINYNSDRPTVSARELHDFLGVDTPYRKWFPRMCEYGFTEAVDYTPDIFVHPLNQQDTVDHQLTIDMAKELCMIQRTDKGKQARQYFLAVEKAWNAPEAVMARALQMADRQLRVLRTDNSRLSVENQIMLPKAEYFDELFDELVDRNLLTNFRETAKQLGIGERVFIAQLVERKYIYRDQKGKLMPYAAHAEKGLFEVKECFNDKTEWSGTQTLITPRGRETFRLLFEGVA